MVKNILAYKYPSYKTNRLPDGTSATEIVADSSIFEFKQQDNLHFINFSAVNFALASRQDYFLISNQPQFIKDFISYQSATTTELGCELTADHQVAVFNTQKIYQDFIKNLGNIIININKSSNDLQLSGCFNF